MSSAPFGVREMTPPEARRRAAQYRRTASALLRTLGRPRGAVTVALPPKVGLIIVAAVRELERAAELLEAKL